MRERKFNDFSLCRAKLSTRYGKCKIRVQYKIEKLAAIIFKAFVCGYIRYCGFSMAVEEVEPLLGWKTVKFRR